MERTVFVFATAAFLFAVGCSKDSGGSAERAATDVKQAEAEKPVTGKTAFWEMYKLAYAWAPDMQVLYVKSATMDGQPVRTGEAAVWTGMFVSPSKMQAREFTYRAITEGTKRKGVVSGNTQPWSGPVPKGQPFTTAQMKLDSNQAFEKAAAVAAAWLKENPGKDVSFTLGKESRVPAPVWGVLWGTDKTGYAVVVDATDGTIIK